MTEPKEWLGKASMFMSGFVMLTPHRIALSCAPHVAKRFHLPPATVGLFIYKMHNPMELASLSSTFLSNVVSWINDSTIKTDYLKRYCSIIFMWLMTLCSVMTYFLFITGDDFGYLQYFYWNMIFFTFINGFASSFGFTVNFNTSMYGAGLPASGGVTFLLHNGYKWLYKKYHWAEYDYNLMILQLSTTIGFLLFTSILWTVDQCWNILKPKYAGWAIQGILGAVNNTNITNDNLGKKEYKYGTDDATESGGNYSAPGTAITFNADKDLGNRWNAVATYLTKDVGGKFKDAWDSGWNNDAIVYIPLIISSVMAGSAFLDIFISMFIIRISDDIQIFVYLSLIFSLMAIISIICGVLVGNYQDKVKLKAVNIRNTNFEYTGYEKYHKGNSYTTLDAGQTASTVDTTTLGTDKVYFKMETNNNNPPKVKVKDEDTTIVGQIKELAKANIIAVIGICSIIVIFACVLLFSVIIFYGDKKSLAAPLFLFTFIASTSALTFGGIAISSAIAGIYMFNQLGGQQGTPNPTLDKAKYSSWVLLPSFGVIAILGIILSLTDSYVVWPITGFLSFGFLAAIVSAVTADQGIQKLFKGGGAGNGADWSPIAMLGFSMGFVYAFYPSISPYQLVDDEELGNDIELWTLLISSIPTFVIALLDIEWKNGMTVIGPTGKWYKDDNAFPKRTDKHTLWHLTHVAFIPYFFCIFLFFSIMHFPEGRIGKFFKGHPIRTALLSVTFNTVEETLEAVGFAGGGQQTGFTGPIVQFNVLFMFVILNVSMFTGYLKQTLLKLSIL